jgi:ubiquinone/menaquinone biosynthesis C-methylase UbiE
MSNTSVSISPCPAACQPVGIYRQFARPTGWLGWCTGQLMAFKNQLRSEWVLDLLKIQSSDRILEVGFGSGVDLQRASVLAAQGFVAGIDHSDVMFQQASRRNRRAIQTGRVELHCTSADKIPYGDASFDTLYSINVAQFWQEPLIVLTELKRVLKPGGKIAIAIQPRIPKATEGTVQETGRFLMNLLTTAEFEQVHLEQRSLKPVSVVCGLGIKPMPNSC